MGMTLTVSNVKEVELVEIHGPQTELRGVANFGTRCMLKWSVLDWGRVNSKFVGAAPVATCWRLLEVLR